MVAAAQSRRQTLRRAQEAERSNMGSGMEISLQDRLSDAE